MVGTMGIFTSIPRPQSPSASPPESGGWQDWEIVQGCIREHLDLVLDLTAIGLKPTNNTPEHLPPWSQWSISPGTNSYRTTLMGLVIIGEVMVNPMENSRLIESVNQRHGLTFGLASDKKMDWLSLLSQPEAFTYRRRPMSGDQGW